MPRARRKSERVSDPLGSQQEFPLMFLPITNCITSKIILILHG